MALYESTTDDRIKAALAEVRPAMPWGGIGEPSEPTFSSDIARADQERACWPDIACLGCAHGEPFLPDAATANGHKAYQGDDGHCCRGGTPYGKVQAEAVA